MLEIKGDIGAYFSGGPVIVKSCNIIIQPPKVKDVLIFGESTFFTLVEMLSDPEKLFNQVIEEHPEFAGTAPFQMLIEFLQHPESHELQSDLLNFLYFICPDYDKVQIDKAGIKFLQFDEDQNKDVIKGMVNQFSCEGFGTTLKELFSIENAVSNDKFDYNIDKNNAKAVALVKQFEEGRKKVERLKRKNRDEEDSNRSILANIASILSVALNQTPDNILNLTLFQMFNIFHRWLLKRQYDIYEQGVLLNPWASKDDIDEDSVPKEWTQDFYDKYSN